MDKLNEFPNDGRSFPDLPISTVERDTGLSKDTLRVWERRYGFPQPERDATGERVYPAAQVEKLRLIKRLLDQGLRPSKLIGATATELAELIERHSQSKAAEREPDSPDLAPLIEMVRMHRCDELRAAFTQGILKRGLQRFVTELVAPMNEAIGEAWMRGDIEVHEEHLYTEQIQNALRGAIGSQGGSGQRPKVLLTTFPEEQHSLGLLMVEAVLVTEGCQCVSIGTQTPLTDIRQAAVNGGFDVVALSFSAAFPGRQAVEGLRALRGATPQEIEIWAGGRGLPERAPDIEGVRRVRGLADVLAAVGEWRAVHRARLS